MKTRKDRLGIAYDLLKQEMIVAFAGIDDRGFYWEQIPLPGNPPAEKSNAPTKPFRVVGFAIPRPEDG